MIKVAATLSGAVIAIGFAVIASPTVQADEPFVKCPYNPSVPGAQMEYFNKKTAELRAMQADVNTRVLGPMSGPERDAWAAGPEGAAEIARERQVVYDRDNPPLSCTPLPMPAGAPYFDPDPLEPTPERPLIVDSYSPPEGSAVDCTKLRAAYESLGPVVNFGDAANKINRLHIPGLSQISAASLAGCAIDALPAAIANPSDENQQRVFDGACGAVDQGTNGIINPCGDTPAG